MGRPKGASNIDCSRPDKDKITISFDRFQLLRTIVCAAKTGKWANHLNQLDRDRLDSLLKELDRIEARDWIGLLDVGTTEEIASGSRLMVDSEYNPFHP